MQKGLSYSHSSLLLSAIEMAGYLVSRLYFCHLRFFLFTDIHTLFADVYKRQEGRFWKILQSEQTCNRTAGGKTLADPETDDDVYGHDVDSVRATWDAVCNL